MKKLVSFSVVFMLGYAAIAQDTLATSNKMGKDSMQIMRDTAMATSQQTQNAMDTSKNGTYSNAGSSAGSSDTMTKTSGVNVQSSSTTTTVTKDSSTKVTATDRVLMKDDKMYMVKKGDSVLLEKSYKLESGAVVSTTGSVRYPSGHIAQLKNGQFIELKKPAGTVVKKVTERKKTTTSTKTKSKY